MKYRDDIFNSWVFSAIIVEQAAKKKKIGLYPELNYETLVDSIASWLNQWMRFTMPRPDELIDLLSDAFLLVMKAKRMKVEINNYEAFSEALRVDVYKKLIEYIKYCNIGVKTYYKMNTNMKKEKE